MKWFLTLAPIIVYVVTSFLADFDLIPKEYLQVWWFDDVGHVVIFGTVGLSLAILAQRYYKKWQLGIVATILLAIIDEFAQLLLPARSFTLHDLQMSLVGILLATLGYWIVYTLRSKRLDDR